MKRVSAASIMILLLLALVSCDGEVGGGEVLPPPPPYDGPVTATMSAKATTDKVSITITSDEKADTLFSVYSVGAWAYLNGDITPRVGGEVDDFSLKLADVTLEKGENTVEVPRYNEDGTDNYVRKFYLVDDAKHIAAGPYWVTEIEPLHASKTYSPKSKKGVCASTRNLVDAAINELGVQYIFCGLGMGGHIAANEYVNPDGTEEDLSEENRLRAESGELVPFDYNGTTYYFVESAFKNVDLMYKRCTDRGVQIVCNILVPNDSRQEVVPYYLYTQEAKGSTAHFVMPNTSNEKGAGYWGAYMAYVAQRYSTPERYVSYFIIGNELDYPREWNAINKDNDPLPSVERYSEEYYRAMRIASLSLAEASAGQEVMACFTYWWNGTISNTRNEYHPYEIMEDLMEKSRSQGNFKWGIASHGYGYNLEGYPIKSDTSAKYVDTIKGDVEAKRISMNNLEVYDLYLGDEARRNPDGSMRHVLVTEVGINSGAVTDVAAHNADQLLGNLAYCYYKAELVESVIGWTYFSMMDGVNGPYWGLRTSNGSNKKSYLLWRQVDKTNPEEYESYIPAIQYGPSSKDYFSEGTSYLDVVKTISSISGTDRYIDWDERWNDMMERLYR